MKVQFLNALQHSALFKGLDGFDDLPGGQAEFRVVPGAGFPLAFAHGVELGPQSKQGHDLQLLGDFQDERKLGHLLNGDETFTASLLGQQGHADEALILVAVAEHHGVGMQFHGKRDHQLGLGARLQAVVVLGASPHDLFDHFLHLVGLHWVYALVGTVVGELLDGLAEGLVQLDDAVRQDLGKAQDQGRADALLPQVLDDLIDIRHQVLILRGGHFQVTFAIDRKVIVAPFLHAVQSRGILDRPVLHGHR